MKKFTLTDRLNESILIDGSQYFLDLSFDNVLRVFELFSDDEFLPFERIDIAFEMLTGIDLVENNIQFIEVKEGLNKIFSVHLDIELFAEATDDKTLSTDQDNFFDMYEDAERIYAMFIKEYGIDLFEQHGKLHFKKFNTLLGQALDRDLKEIVEIRAQKLPTPNKHNADERKRILQLKKVYKLKTIADPDIAADKIDDTFNKLANMFRPEGVK